MLVTTRSSLFKCSVIIHGICLISAEEASPALCNATAIPASRVLCGYGSFTAQAQGNHPITFQTAVRMDG